MGERTKEGKVASWKKAGYHLTCHACVASDHRITGSSMGIDAILSGEGLDDLIEQLQEQWHAQRLLATLKAGPESLV